MYHEIYHTFINTRENYGNHDTAINCFNIPENSILDNDNGKLKRITY